MTSSSPNKRHPAGFTLLEVLISMVILAFIGIAIYQTVGETFRLRDQLTNQGDFYNGIRMSMGIMERDIAMIYSPSLMMPEPTNTQPAVAPTLAAPGTINPVLELPATEYWGSPIDPNGLRPSRFVGTDTKISFVSASHIRVYKDSNESTFAKIAYELAPDKSGYTEDSAAKVLVKVESIDAFNDEEKKNFIRKFPLQYGITKFKYKYYRKDKDEWIDAWDSDKEDMKYKYPDIIQVTLEVKGPSKMFFEGTYHFRPEIPLRGLSPST